MPFTCVFWLWTNNRATSVAKHLERPQQVRIVLTLRIPVQNLWVYHVKHVEVFAHLTVLVLCSTLKRVSPYSRMPLHFGCESLLQVQFLWAERRGINQDTVFSGYKIGLLFFFICISTSNFNGDGSPKVLGTVLTGHVAMSEGRAVPTAVLEVTGVSPELETARAVPHLDSGSAEKQNGPACCHARPNMPLLLLGPNPPWASLHGTDVHHVDIPSLVSAASLGSLHTTQHCAMQTYSSSQRGCLSIKETDSRERRRTCSWLYCRSAVDLGTKSRSDPRYSVCSTKPNGPIDSSGARIIDTSSEPGVKGKRDQDKGYRRWMSPWNNPSKEETAFVLPKRCSRQSIYLPSKVKSWTLHSSTSNLYMDESPFFLLPLA